MKILKLIPCLAAAFLAASAAQAQTTLAKWTFESLTISAGSSYTNGNAKVFTGISPEVGTGTASGYHYGFASSTWGTVTGNGSSKALTGAGWTNNPGGGNPSDYYQFSTSTIGYQNIVVSFDQYSSSTGPGRFYLAYSTDGANFTQFGGIYNVTNQPSWSSSTSTTLNSYTNDLSSIAAITNQAVVYFRIVVANNTSAGGATVAGTGTSRIDNFQVAGINPGIPTLAPATQSTNFFLGDRASFGVTGGGSTPLSYQWYYPNLSTPLTDTGNTSGSGSSTLALSFVNTNQAGTYYVILTNNLGSATGQVSLAVSVRAPIVTNIAYLRTLLLPVTYAPKDTTNLYTVQGIVTSHANTTGSTNTQFYIQDGAAGMLVFISGGSSILPNAGDQVQVTGPLNQFYGQLEISMSALNPAHSFTNISGGNPLPTPVVFNFANQTNITYMKAIESSLVVASGVYFGSSNAYFVSGSTVNLTNLNNLVFPLYINAYVSDIIAAPTPAFGSVTAVMTQHASGSVYTNGFELVATQDADIIGSIPPVGFQSIPGNVVLTWPGSGYILQSATNVAGPFNDLPGAASPYTNDEVTVPIQFFRLEQPPSGT